MGSGKFFAAARAAETLVRLESLTYEGFRPWDFVRLESLTYVEDASG